LGGPAGEGTALGAPRAMSAAGRALSILFSSDISP
jgi:hypothetical protein